MLLLLLFVSFIPFYEAFDPIPKPLNIIRGSNVFTITQNIDFSNNYPNCDILNNALKRINKKVFNTIYVDYKGPVSGIISLANITIKSGCSEYKNNFMWPSENMIETYGINVTSGGIFINSQEIWGTLRALETLVQLIYRTNVGTLCINETVISDQPRFSYRGYMMDTSRHFIPVDIILKNLEAMSISKFNVFHWHIVDDQSFPYQSRSFPNLSQKGSFNQYTQVYTQEDVRKIIHFARNRGIRVIPEFDTPGHTLSWGKSQPNLLTPCYTGSVPNGYFGPIDPIKSSTFAFLKVLYEEIASVFPDNYIHLGGNDINTYCWLSNPNISNFTIKNNFHNDFNQLQSYYMANLINVTKGLSCAKSSLNNIVWQDVFDADTDMDQNSTIIQIYKNSPPWQKEIADVTDSRYRAILSSCWLISSTTYETDWYPFYQCDPQAFSGTNKNLVLGGEAIMLTNSVDETNIIPLSWPRASAIAERLWSYNSLYVLDFASRLEPFRCRLLKSGIAAENDIVNGNFCNKPYDV